MVMSGTRGESDLRCAVVRGGVALLLWALILVGQALSPSMAMASRASRTAAMLALADSTVIDAGTDTLDSGAGEVPFEQGPSPAKAGSGPVSTGEPPSVPVEGLTERVAALKEEGRYREAAALIGENVKDMERGPERARLQVTEAGFLAWAHDYDQAIEIYEGLLKDYPEMVSARLGLARTLSWKGEYDEAVVEYGKALKTHPKDREAMLGLARTLAWKGDYRTALATYRAILSEDPSDSEARLGLGRTLWWMGDREGARRELGLVLADDPGNAEAAEMRHKIHLATGPLLSLDFVVSDDSDSNHLEIYSAGLYYSPRRELKLNLVFSQFEASRHTDRSRARSLGLRLSYRFLEKNTVALRSSLLSLDTPLNPTSEVTGGISLRREMAGGFRAGAGVSRYVLLDTAQLIRNDIRIDEFFAYVSGKAISLDFTTGVRYGDYSDGNRRKDFFLDLSKSHEVRGVLLTLGYRLDYRDFDQDLNSGYFDPSNFVAHTFYGRARGGLYGGRIEYDALAAGGLQSFNSTTESTVKLSLQVKGHITERFVIRGGAKYARSALASAAGFKYEEYRAGLDYLF